MPYIKQQDRKDLLKHNMLNSRVAIKNVGELNYIITTIVLNYYNDKGPNYQHINDVLGALEGAKLEFYRRVASPYEDRKIQENGDVY